MRELIFVLSVIILCNCTARNNKDTGNQNLAADNEAQKEIGDKKQADNVLERSLTKVDEQFQIFLDEFPKVELPVIIKGCKVEYSGLTIFSDENPSPYVDEYAFAFGQIITHGNYIGTITLGAADCMLPILTTYKLNGEKIDSKTIAIGMCGSAPCFECEEFMSLTEHYEIYTSDTIKTAECDKNYKAIPGTETIKVTYKEGRLAKTGLIELSEKIEEKIEL